MDVYMHNDRDLEYTCKNLDWCKFMNWEGLKCKFLSSIHLFGSSSGGARLGFSLAHHVFHCQLENRKEGGVSLFLFIETKEKRNISQ